MHQTDWLTRHEKMVIIVVLLTISVVAILITVIFSNRSVARAVGDYQQYVVSQFKHNNAAATVTATLLQRPMEAVARRPDDTATATFSSCVSQSA